MDSTPERPLAIAARLAAAVGIPRDQLDELHRLHARQWRLEDRTRVTGALPETIAAAKADIDRSNARRHRLVDLIDNAVAQVAALEPSRHYSETVGELCDRLLILDLKQQALSRIDATPRFDRTCRHLAAVVTQLIDDLANRRAVLPPRIGVKIYNGSAGSTDTEPDAELHDWARSKLALER